MDYKSFAEECVQDLMALQEDFHSEYNVNGYENWFYNQGTGLLTFSTGDDPMRAAQKKIV